MRNFVGQASSGGRTGINDSPTAAYMSFDSGATNINDFNNSAHGGVYGNWLTHTPSQINDAFTNGSGAPLMALGLSETRALDAVGYTYVTPTTTVPEPTSIALMAAGLLAVAGIGRRKIRESDA